MMVNLCPAKVEFLQTKSPIVWWLRCNNSTLNMILCLHVCCFWCSGLWSKSAGKCHESHVTLTHFMKWVLLPKSYRYTQCTDEPCDVKMGQSRLLLDGVCATLHQLCLWPHGMQTFCKLHPCAGPPLCHPKGRARIFLGKDHLAYYTWDCRFKMHTSTCSKTLSRSQRGLDNLTVLDRKMAKCLRVRRCWQDSNPTLRYTESKASKPMPHNSARCLFR